MGEPLILDADERRVIAVLIEKSLTTPQSYPMTINSIVSGCNQKSNRYPVVEMVDEEVEEVLERLRVRELITVTFPATGRTEKYRQELTRRLEVSGQQMGVLGELLLRGQQTVGELRARASRMKRIADVSELEGILAEMIRRDPPLVKRLTPEGVRRGARVTHHLYSEVELAEILAAEESGAASMTAGAAPARTPRGDLAALQAQVDDLRRRVAALEARFEGG